MPTAPAALPARDDTLLGVCEGIGEEFGFHANWLRVVFATGMLWNPLAMIAAYLVLGVVLAIGRWWLPVARPATGSAAIADADAPALPLAA